MPQRIKTFPYYFNGKGFFPAISIKLLSSTENVKALALVDSGASISIFNGALADLLDIDIEKGEQTILGGVGGRIVGYTHMLHMELEGKKFDCPVVFSREYVVSFNLLGRKGFFERFDIRFSEKRRLLIFEEI